MIKNMQDIIIAKDTELRNKIEELKNKEITDLKEEIKEYKNHVLKLSERPTTKKYTDQSCSD